jgi:hypothetical protein
VLTVVNSASTVCRLRLLTQALSRRRRQQADIGVIGGSATAVAGAVDGIQRKVTR